MEVRLKANPQILGQHRELVLVEHPFGSIKQWMNQGAFLMRGDSISGRIKTCRRATDNAYNPNMPHTHWSFFELIDDDLHSLGRYVEFATDNYGTYSAHLTRLYLQICSEVDVIAKLLCKRIDPKGSSKHRRI
jgi:hypothetical protein